MGTSHFSDAGGGLEEDFVLNSGKFLISMGGRQFWALLLLPLWLRCPMEFAPSGGQEPPQAQTGKQQESHAKKHEPDAPAGGGVPESYFRSPAGTGRARKV